MPYIVKSSVVGDIRKVEYLPPGPAQIGYREKYSGEEIRIEIMRDQELAQSATIAVEQRLAPEEHEGVTEEEIRQLQSEDRGLGTFHSYYQQFSKR